MWHTHLRAIAHSGGIGKYPLIDFDKVTRIDLTNDGADEFDPYFNLIKGGGGALLREKIVASLSDREIIVADESQPVAHLGAFPLPLRSSHLAGKPYNACSQTWAVTPHFATHRTIRLLSQTTAITSSIATLGRIDAPPTLEKKINALCGVVECGLFIGLTDHIIIGKQMAQSKNEPLSKQTLEIL